MAGFCWSQGIGIRNINLFFNETNFYLNEFLSLTFTLFWIIGIINAINWFDGLDALASGISFNIFIGCGIKSSLNMNLDIAFISFVLAGSCLGFLKYNFNNAKIHMGDCGSNLLGFNIAIICLLTASAGSNIFYESNQLQINIIQLFIFLSLPITDMTFVIFNRIYNGNSPFFPDRNHIHHRLLRLGLRPNQIVIILYFFTFLTTLVGVII